jgi:hypothetical protein
VILLKTGASMFRLIALLLLVFSLCAACGDGLPTTPPPLTRVIDFWQPVSGTLAAGETQAWIFIGQSGDAVRARALSPVDDITLALQSPDGQVLSQGELAEAILPAEGTYTLFVASNEGGQYELGLGYTDRANPADYTPTPLPVTVAVPTPTLPYNVELGTLISTIQGGQTLSGAIGLPDERHLYMFEGNAGNYVHINMRVDSGSIDPVLTLYSPDSAPIATDDNTAGNKGALLRNIRLLEDGTYTIAASGHGLTGGYQVTLFTSAQPAPVTPTFIIQPTPTPPIDILMPTVGAADGSVLQDHVAVSAAINRPGDFNRHTVYATLGDVITIGVSPAGSGLIPQIELYNPDGVLVATATVDNSQADGDALVSALVAEATGVYIAFVTGEASSTGTYLISYGNGVSREDVRRGETFPDQPVEGHITRRGLREVWSLFLREGDVISAAASPSDAVFDPTLELVAPDGALILQDTDSGGDRAALISAGRAPVDGLYHLYVTAAGGFGAGAYSLVWRYVNLAPTPTPQPGTVLVMSYVDTVPPETYQFYPFQGRAGTQVLIQVIAQPETNLDPVAALLDIEGIVIAEGDDTEGSLNPRFVATLPADGTYTVRVNGYLSSGDFVLTVESLFSASETRTE